MTLAPPNLNLCGGSRYFRNFARGRGCVEQGRSQLGASSFSGRFSFLVRFAAVMHSVRPRIIAGRQNIGGRG